MNGVLFGSHSFSDLDFVDDVALLAELLRRTWAWDDGNRGRISGAWGELAEDKSPSPEQQGGRAIDNHSPRPEGCGSENICISWLSYPLNNSKLSWYLTS